MKIKHFYADDTYVYEHDQELLKMITDAFKEYYQNTTIQVKAPIILASHLNEAFKKKDEYVHVWEVDGKLVAFNWLGLDYPIFTEPVASIRMFYISKNLRKTSTAYKILIQMLNIKNMPQELLKYPQTFEVVSHDGKTPIPTGKRGGATLLAATYFSKEFT